MRFVQQAVHSPHHCAALPYVGNSESRGFIDTGVELAGYDQHVYISIEALQQMITVAGLDAPDSGMQAQIDDLTRRLHETEAERDRAQSILDHIDAIESADFRARKKAGRPKRDRDEVAA